MAVNTIGSSAPGTLPQSPGSNALGTGGSVMGKEDFLKLLVTQLSNQDPLNPMDGQQFAAQLAQFSSVEQLVNISGALTTQQELQELQALSTSNSIAAGLIGKHIDAGGNQINLKRPDDALIHFDLPSTAEKVTVTIKNASGQTLRTLEVGSKTEGSHEIAWDGEDAGGAHLPDGSYTFEVAGEGIDGIPVQGEPHMRGRVDRVSFGPDGAMLWINGLAVPLAAVQSVDAPPAS